MATMTLDTAGESHGRGCFALVQGFPAMCPIDLAGINADLARRQKGYGRGARQKIETDQVEVLAGVLHGVTMGAPILLAVWNRDVKIERMPELKAPRPGHADLAGALKFDGPIRHILERSSARETTARVAAGALARQLLAKFGIEVRSHVRRIGPAAVAENFAPTMKNLADADASDVRCLDATVGDAMRAAIQAAGKAGDTLGGVYEVIVSGLPIGLGSHAQWTAKLDGRLAQALVSIQAHKGMEVGLGFRSAEKPGSQVHDPIDYAMDGFARSGGFFRPSDGHGGTEGGMSTGSHLIVRAVMKPISTLMKPLRSVDMVTKAPAAAGVERSDVCAVPAASVVGEAAVAFTLAQAFVEKFGGDSLAELEDNYRAYLKRIARPRRADEFVPQAKAGATAAELRAADTTETNPDGAANPLNSKIVPDLQSGPAESPAGGAPAPASVKAAPAAPGAVGQPAATGSGAKVAHEAKPRSEKKSAGKAAQKAGGDVDAVFSIYTDGGCWNNPGPGAWAALIIEPDLGRRLIGAAQDRTTNNQMEISAALEALKATATQPSVPVEMFVDSEYLKNGATVWIKDWKRRGWRTSTKQPVKNQDLWEALDAAMAGRDLRWEWVRGHRGNFGNETCDALTQMLIRRFVQSGKSRPVRIDIRLEPEQELTDELFERHV